MSQEQQHHQQKEPTVVWIIGGGFAGLATCAALRKLPQHRPNVYILECQSHDDYYSPHAGAVAKVGPNGLTALQQLDPDLPQRIIEAGQILHEIIQENTVSVPLETAEWPQILIPWGRLRQFLQELVPRDCILTGVGHDICGYQVDEHDNKVYLVNAHQERLQLFNKNNTTIPPPDWIVAADGVYSPFQSLVRMQATILKGPDASAIQRSNLHDNGRVNINAIVARPLHVRHGTALGYYYNHPCDNASYTCFCVSLGENLTSLAVSVADRLDECGSLVQYFAKSVTPQLPQKEFLLQHVLKDAPQYIVALLEATDPQRLFIRRSTQLTMVGPSFVSSDHRVVLVGDAAHAMSPSYGQNFNVCLEDAVSLGWAVLSQQQQQDNNNNNNTAMDWYSATRMRRCEEMFRRSAERVGKQQQQATEHDDDSVLQWIDGWEPPSTATCT